MKIPLHIKTAPYSNFLPRQHGLELNDNYLIVRHQMLERFARHIRAYDSIGTGSARVSRRIYTVQIWTPHRMVGFSFNFEKLHQFKFPFASLSRTDVRALPTRFVSSRWISLQRVFLFQHYAKYPEGSNHFHTTDTLLRRSHPKNKSLLGGKKSLLLFRISHAEKKITEI
jgi:hypothetical protein